VARPGTDQTVASGDLVTLDGSASQPSGGIQSFAWTQTGGPAVTLADANKARATFVAPAVASNAVLSFRLTVVNNADQADSDSTLITVEPATAAAVATALSLFQGPLQPQAAASTDDCPSATSGLTPDAAAAQRGLWLAARSLAIAKGVDVEDPSAFLDASRMIVASQDPHVAGVAGQVEALGLTLLGSLAQERDPALREAVAARLIDAGMLDDPAALLGGGTEVTDTSGIAIAPTPDADAANAHAVVQLLASRSRCVDPTQAVALTSAGLRLIANAAVLIE